jgi:hypothetical protein
MTFPLPPQNQPQGQPAQGQPVHPNTPPPLQYGGDPMAPPPSGYVQDQYQGPYSQPQTAQQNPAVYPAPHSSRTPLQKAQAAVGIWGAIAVVAIVLGLSIPEDDHSQWSSVHAWGALAILGAVLTAIPAFAGSVSLSAHRAWQGAAIGAGILAVFWVLLVLPSVGSNMSLVLTVGVAAGCAAAWLAPGRPVQGRR